jgi:hypothetical protein
VEVSSIRITCITIVNVKCSLIRRVLRPCSLEKSIGPGAWAWVEHHKLQALSAKKRESESFIGKVYESESFLVLS